MNSPAFESTLPLGEPELIRASAFQLYLDDLVRQAGTPAGQETSASRLSALSPSLLQDLLRFEQGGGQTELLEVVAASMRHARPLCIHLQREDRVVPLTIFPRERLAHCPLPLPDLLGPGLARLQVLHVEPAVLRPLDDPTPSLVAPVHEYHPLAPLTWELAMRGSRDALLPEIGGSAAYRLAPGFDGRQLALEGDLRQAVRCLQRRTCGVREISEWPGFDRERAARLLNALYLQASLIVSRSHPAAA
jgi:hypothetical protein